jgi:phosphoglycolate phosphatase
MSPSPIKGILFDKDGTLLDFHLSWAEINRHAAAHAAQGDAEFCDRLLAIGGLDARTGRYNSGSLLAAGSAADVARAWVAAGSPFSIATLTGNLDAIFRSGVHQVVPVTDLAALFAGLKTRGLKLGVASSDSEAAIHMTLARFACSDQIDFVAGYDSGYGHKPEPGMLLAFANQTGLMPADIAMVGDNWHDMELAQRARAGVRVAVLTGTSNRAELAPLADYCLDSVRDLEVALFGPA